MRSISIKAVCFFFPDIYMYNRKMSFMIIMKIGQWCRNCKSRHYRDHIPGTVWWSHEYQREVITIYFILMNTILFSYSTKNDSLYFLLFLKMIDKNRFGLDLRDLAVKCNYERYLIIRKWLTVILTLLTWYYRYCITSVYYSIFNHLSTSY